MSIYFRKDNRYEGRIIDKATGKRKSFYGKTAEEVEIQIKKAAETAEAAEAALSCELTAEEIFLQWIKAISGKVKPSTAAVYRGRAEKHILPEFGCLKVCEITARQIQNFVADKLNSGLSACYVADIVVVLKGMLDFSMKHYGVKNVVLDVIMPKRKKAEVLLLNKEQQNKLQIFLKKNEDVTSLGIAVSFFMGLRIGEICALKWKDIDFKNKMLKVSKTVQRIKETGGNKRTQVVVSEPKSDSSVRMIPVPDCVLQLMKQHKSKDDFYILSNGKNPVEPRKMQYRFAQILKKENLPSIHFHALRHMFATNCVELGFDVKSLSEILGHSSVEITLNRYVHSSMENKKKYMNKICFAA